MRNPNPNISHAHAARHRRAPTAPIHAKIDAELLRRVDAARGDTPRTRVVEAALEAWLERLRAATDSALAREIAARVWCDQAMGNVVMDVDAAEAIAKIIDDVRRNQGHGSG